MVYGAPHMRSRCAPASEPPISARGSFHTSRRRSHELPSSSCGIGHSTVRSSSAMTMSSSVPKFDWWRSCAISRTMRPRSGWFSGA